MLKTEVKYNALQNGVSQSDTDFVLHVARKSDISEEMAHKIINQVFESLYYFVKIKNKKVTCRIGEFVLRKTRNNFESIELWETKKRGALLRERISRSPQSPV